MLLTNVLVVVLISSLVLPFTATLNWPAPPEKMPVSTSDVKLTDGAAADPTGTTMAPVMVPPALGKAALAVLWAVFARSAAAFADAAVAAVPVSVLVVLLVSWVMP